MDPSIRYLCGNAASQLPPASPCLKNPHTMGTFLLFWDINPHGSLDAISITGAMAVKRRLSDGGARKGVRTNQGSPALSLAWRGQPEASRKAQGGERPACHLRPQVRVVGLGAAGLGNKLTPWLEEASAHARAWP